MIKNSYQHFQVCCDDRDVITVWFQHANRSMNIFDDEVLHELGDIIDQIESMESVRAVLFRSSKDSGFLAGADVQKIADVTPDKVDSVLLCGQKLFDRIEKLSPPTVAIIHGPCLGGGLEFALACRYRIARDSGSTRLGLPEVQLGVIPGWGGTQRLPSRVGLMQSLPMILQGKKLTAAKAFKIGLVDRIASDRSWKDAVDRFVDHLLDDPDMCNRRAQERLFDRFLNHTKVGRMLVFRGARKRTRREAMNYPAIDGALRAIESGFDRLTDGYASERREFSQLIESPTCRNLLSLFFRRERARNMSTWVSSSGSETHPLPIDSVGIIGAGAMGAGIGQLAALKGYRVVLKEVNQDLADAGHNRIKHLLDEMVLSKRLPVVDYDNCLKRIQVTSKWEPLQDVDLVVEAVVERADVKRSVFKELDRVTKPHTLLASNTSSLSVSVMSDATKRPELVAGLHFFNPVHRMDLVEVVRASKTSDEAMLTLVKFVKSLGKTPVVTSDSPGFLVNRVLFPYVGEAVHMVCEGESIERIDHAARKFGMPMGPLELLDHVGIDIAHHVSGSLENVIRENDEVISLLGKLVAAGATGKKSRLGFYRYSKGRKAAAADMAAYVRHYQKEMHPNIQFADDGLSDIQRRLVYPLINESVRCLEEHVIADAWMVDLSMVLGTGFAPFLGGPLSVGEKIGWDVVWKNLQTLQVMHGLRFEPASLVEKLAQSHNSLFAEKSACARSQDIVTPIPKG